MTAVGVLYPNKEIWFESLAYMAVFLIVGLLSTSLVWELLSPILAFPTYERIQARKTEMPLYKEEIRDSLMCAYCVACISAWPYAMWREGRPMAFKKTIEETAFFGSYTYYFVKLLFTAAFADTWTYWKHYAFHHPSIYAIHKGHHAFHNPSTFAGFAVHPIEAFWTFCPILALCIP